MASNNETREKNFVAKVEEADMSVIEGEAKLSVSHDGRNWNSLRMTKVEAEKVIAALKQHFGI